MRPINRKDPQMFPKNDIDINDLDQVRDALSDPNFIWEL
jgi:hypothetical protein